MASENQNENADLRSGRRRRLSQADPNKIDRLPPHSIEAEQGIFGCVLLSPTDCLNTCLERKLSKDDFYEIRHQVIYDVMVGMFERKEPVDLITLQQELKDISQIEGVGGLAYLASLEDVVPSAANLEYYLTIVKEKSQLRTVIRECTGIVSQVYEHQGEVDEILDSVEKTLIKLTQEETTKEICSVKDLVHKAITTIEDYHKNQGVIPGVSTGFVDLDKLTTGLHGGEMIVIAARPSMGKTSLAMNIAEHVALEQKLPVGVFSLEMTSESLILRMLCSRARVNLRQIRDGFMVQDDFRKLTLTAGKLTAAPLYIDDSSGLSILQLKAKARRMHQMYGIKLFIIDYLQLLNSTNKRAENRQQEIADISGGCKAIAKELNVPVIVLSQLNRELEKDKNRKPRMSDLRESGAIEQDADLIGLLYKPNQSDDEDEEAQDTKQINFLIAKQRNGPAQIDVHLTFLKTFTRFESSAKVQQDDLPGTED